MSSKGKSNGDRGEKGQEEDFEEKNRWEQSDDDSVEFTFKGKTFGKKYHSEEILQQIVQVFHMVNKAAN